MITWAVLQTHPIGKHGVPDSNRITTGLRNTIPSVRLLGKGATLVVITIEGHKGGGLHPTVAQFLVRVIICRNIFRESKLQGKAGNLLKPQVSAPTYAIYSVRMEGNAR